jgi:uridine kinase
LKRNNKKAIQVSIDGFHFDKVHRYKLGKDSARGYYEDSYNEVDFVEKVLIASQKENPKITIATHNLETDEYLHLKPISITNDTIIITDGAYLFKPIYKDYWDLKIYLKTDFQTALIRAIKRDVKLLGGLKATKERYKNRYHKSSEIYINENKPEKLADIIIDNTEFENLKLIKNTPLSLV